MAVSSNEDIICRYITLYLSKQWPDVDFKVDIMRDMMTFDVKTRILVPLPSGQHIYVVQIDDEKDFNQLANFKIKDETIAHVMLLLG